MSIISNQTAKQKVMRLLRAHPELRDNDHRLIANFWKTEFPYRDCSARDMLELVARGSLTNPETIRRIRQKLQETIPELRGECYQVRHKEREPKERQAIRDWI